MEKLKFYDMSKRKNGKPVPYMSDKYKIVTKKGRRFAVATSPSGSASWKILGMAGGPKKKPMKKKPMKRKRK